MIGISRGGPTTTQVAASCAVVRAPGVCDETGPSAPSSPFAVGRMPMAFRPAWRGAVAADA
ncbi:MAG: hypothetical protein L6Q35_13955, partial [Phycisphaerales bacterium]|nr:hypothetical protein [Phycisphaerales bacterium]